MLFDKTPDEILSEDERAKAQRLREEQEARERWQSELESGRRQREERREVAKRFQEKVQDATPVGRAKAAIESGATVFQLVLPLALGSADKADPAADHNPVLNAVEAQGWRLLQASYVTREPRPFPETEPPAAPPSGLFAVYIFRRSI